MLIVTQENRIVPSQLPASVGCRERPVDLVGGPISFGLPVFSGSFREWTKSPVAMVQSLAI